MNDSVIVRAPQKVARDLARFDRRKRVREAVSVHEAPQRAKVREKAVARPFMRVSFLSIFFYIVCVTVLLVIVYHFMQLSVVNSQYVALQKELTTLKREETVLKKEYEGRLNLQEIEQYAILELGMVKLEEPEIIYIDLSGEDHGEVIERDGLMTRLKKALTAIASNIMAYLG